MRTILLALFLAGCLGADSKETVLTPEMMSAELTPEVKEAVQTLDEEEQRLLVGYLARSALTGGLPARGVSIGAALAQQRAWLAAQEAEAVAARATALAEEAAREAAEARLRGAVDVRVTRTRFVPANYRAGTYQDRIEITLELRNDTDIPISGVKGVLVFSDLFGDVIRPVSFSYDGGISVGLTATWNPSLDYNQFMAEDVKLATTPLSRMTVEWRPEMIVFSDGTRWLGEE